MESADPIELNLPLVHAPRLLVVDDDLDTRHMLKAFFSTHGFKSPRRRMETKGSPRSNAILKSRSSDVDPKVIEQKYGLSGEAPKKHSTEKEILIVGGSAGIGGLSGGVAGLVYDLVTRNKKYAATSPTQRPRRSRAESPYSRHSGTGAS